MDNSLSDEDIVEIFSEESEFTFLEIPCTNQTNTTKTLTTPTPLLDIQIPKEVIERNKISLFKIINNSKF